MIAYIEGRIDWLDPAQVHIDIQGLGYEVKISLSTYSALKGKEKCRLATYLHVKEDAHTLYGFHLHEEKKMFLDLISISGIGPNTALMVLSSTETQDLKQAIVQEDIRSIQSIKGIGPKTAQRIVLELKDKFKKDALISQSNNIPLTSQSSIKQEALAALTVLGIPKAVAEKNIDTIIRANDHTITVEKLIKIALKS